MFIFSKVLNITEVYTYIYIHMLICCIFNLSLLPYISDYAPYLEKDRDMAHVFLGTAIRNG
jgi:hypothetical protein